MSVTVNFIQVAYKYWSAYFSTIYPAGFDCVISLQYHIRSLSSILLSGTLEGPLTCWNLGPKLGSTESTVAYSIILSILFASIWLAQNDDRPSNSWLFLWLSTPPSDIFRCRSHGFSNMLRLLSVDLPSGDLVIEPLDGFCYGWEFWKNRKPWPLHHQIIEESYQLSIIIPIQWSGYCNIPYGSKYFLRRDKNHPECSLTNAQKLGKSHLLLLSNQLCSPKEEGKHVIVLSCH